MLLVAPMIFLAGCVDSTGDLRIITGRVPGEHEHKDVAGTVVSVDGCIALELPDGVAYPVIWPLGFQLKPDKASVSYGNESVTVGQELTESRGYLIAREEFGTLTDPAQLTGFDDCSPNAETFLVLVNVEDFNTPE